MLIAGGWWFGKDKKENPGTPVLRIGELAARHVLRFCGLVGDSMTGC